MSHGFNRTGLKARKGALVDTKRTRPVAVKCQPTTMSWHCWSCGSLNVLGYCQQHEPIPCLCVSAPLAEEDKAEGGEGVDEDPEARDKLLFEGDARGLLGGLVFGQLLEFGRVGIARVHVVDEALGGGALLGSCSSVSQRGMHGALRRLPEGRIPIQMAVPAAERATEPKHGYALIVVVGRGAVKKGRLKRRGRQGQRLYAVFGCACNPNDGQGGQGVQGAGHATREEKHRVRCDL